MLRNTFSPVLFCWSLLLFISCFEVTPEGAKEKERSWRLVARILRFLRPERKLSRLGTCFAGGRPRFESTWFPEYYRGASSKQSHENLQSNGDVLPQKRMQNSPLTSGGNSSYLWEPDPSGVLSTAGTLLRYPLELAKQGDDYHLSIA